MTNRRHLDRESGGSQLVALLLLQQSTRPQLLWQLTWKAQPRCLVAQLPLE